MSRRADDDFGVFDRAFRTVVPSYKGNVRSKLKRLGYRINRSSGIEIMNLSKNPTVRCLDCGWKYSIQLSDSCPVCKGDHSRTLDSEDPYSNPVAIFFYPIIGLIIWGTILFLIRVE